MKFLVFALCACACSAVPVSRGAALLSAEATSSAGVRRELLLSHDANAATIHARSDSWPKGDFVNSFETSNGIKNEQEGLRKTVGKVTVIVTKGEYSYMTPEGQLVNIKWFADENGYHPEGDFLPVAPLAVQRSLKVEENKLTRRAKGVTVDPEHLNVEEEQEEAREAKALTAEPENLKEEDKNEPEP